MYSIYLINSWKHAKDNSFDIQFISIPSNIEKLYYTKTSNEEEKRLYKSKKKIAFINEMSRTNKKMGSGKLGALRGECTYNLIRTGF